MSLETQSFMAIGRRSLAVVALLSLLLGAACGGDDDDDGGDADPPPADAGNDPGGDDVIEGTLLFNSASFADGGDLPTQLSCDGTGVSPSFGWAGVPDGASELALTVVDVDAGDFVHWVVWGIDPAAGQFGEGELPTGAVEGATTTGSPGWVPACPPPGEPHSYVATLYVLEAAPGVEPGATFEEFTAAVEGITLDTAQLTGLYASPAS
jgi:hypothetical protein